MACLNSLRWGPKSRGGVLCRLEVWPSVGIWRPQEEESEGMTQADIIITDRCVDKHRQREEGDRDVKQLI